MLGQLSAYSAFGKDVVSLAAPGEYILVFDAEAENAYHYEYGTSFAAPHVTGALVLLLSAFPNCTVLLHIHTMHLYIHTYTYTVRHFPIVSGIASGAEAAQYSGSKFQPTKKVPLGWKTEHWKCLEKRLNRRFRSAQKHVCMYVCMYCFSIVFHCTYV